MAEYCNFARNSTEASSKSKPQKLHSWLRLVRSPTFSNINLYDDVRDDVRILLAIGLIFPSVSMFITNAQSSSIFLTSKMADTHARQPSRMFLYQLPAKTSRLPLSSFRLVFPLRCVLLFSSLVSSFVFVLPFSSNFFRLFVSSFVSSFFCHLSFRLSRRYFYVMSSSLFTSWRRFPRARRRSSSSRKASFLVTLYAKHRSRPSCEASSSYLVQSVVHRISCRASFLVPRAKRRSSYLVQNVVPRSRAEHRSSFFSPQSKLSSIPAEPPN